MDSSWSWMRRGGCDGGRREIPPQGQWRCCEVEEEKEEEGREEERDGGRRNR